jgi:hypothetical protein
MGEGSWRPCHWLQLGSGLIVEAGAWKLVGFALSFCQGWKTLGRHAKGRNDLMQQVAEV